MKIGIITLGCKVNQYESDCIGAELEKLGHTVVTNLEVCDFYIINTCAVTTIAERKSREFIAKFEKLNCDAKVIVCGCASEHNQEQFLKYKNVALVIGTGKKNKISQILDHIGNQKTEISKEYENFELFSTNKQNRAYLKIQDGCNNFCTYCLIPFVRGRSRSRNLDEIVCEANLLAKTAKEIDITGINISDFRIDGQLAFDKLMLALSGVDARIRLGSIEVNIIDEDLLKIMSKMPNFCPHFHLSMQSGCDRILKLMNRHYTKTDFLDRVKLIKTYFPNVALTTDVIVGFPTETDEDFAETVDTIKKIGYYQMHIFPYSKREGTVASKMKLCDGNVVKKRVKILEEINAQNKQNYIISQSKNILTCLTESVEGDFVVGHTENYIKIYLPKDTTQNHLIKVTNLVQYKDGAKADII